MFEYFPRVVRYLKPYWPLATLLGVLIALGGAAQLLAPWPLKVLVDHVLGNHPLPDWMALLLGSESSRSALLFFTVIAGLVVALVHNVLNVADNYVQTKLEQRVILDFRSDLFQ